MVRPPSTTPHVSVTGRATRERVRNVARWQGLSATGGAVFVGICATPDERVDALDSEPAALTHDRLRERVASLGARADGRD